MISTSQTANQPGHRSSAQLISEARNVRDVADKIMFLEPNVSKLITTLTALKKKKSCFSTKYSWFEDDYADRWAQVDASARTTSETTISVVTGQGTRFVPGDLLAIPRASGTVTPPEIVLVTAVSTDTLTVVRGIGGTTTGTIAAASALTFAGTSYAEGALFPQVKSTVPVELCNFTQIFRKPLSITNTARAQKAYGMDDLKLLQFKKAREHKIDINRAFLFGAPSQYANTAPSTSQTMTGGIYNRITTNVYDAGGALTRNTMERFAQMAFRYGDKDEKVLLASPTVVSAITQMALSQMQIAKPGKTDFGVNVVRYITGHGTWLVMQDKMLENGVSGKNGFGSDAFSLDLDEFQIRYLSGNGVNRDTKYLEDVIQDGSDRRADEYLTECGLEIHNEKYHARLYNVTGWSA
jgi:hypothetical protein